MKEETGERNRANKMQPDSIVRMNLLLKLDQKRTRNYIALEIHEIQIDFENYRTSDVIFFLRISCEKKKNVTLTILWSFAVQLTNKRNLPL